MTAVLLAVMYTTVGQLTEALEGTYGPEYAIRMAIGAGSVDVGCADTLNLLVPDQRAWWWDAHQDPLAVPVVVIREAPQGVAWATVKDAMEALRQYNPNQAISIAVGRGFKTAPIGIRVEAETVILYETTRAEN